MYVRIHNIHLSICSIVYCASPCEMAVTNLSILPRKALESVVRKAFKAQLNNDYRLFTDHP